MKRFTLKDFILYNGPCFSCGSKVVVKMVSSKPETNEFTNLQQTFKDGNLEATLKITYSFSLNIRVSAKNNKFQVTDMERFLTYLGTRDLFMLSECNKCKGYIYSNLLEFDSRGFLKPMTIMKEVLFSTENNVSYGLISEYSENKTQINILNENTQKIMKMTIPLLPLYKCKNKEKLINKLKTYIIFS